MYNKRLKSAINLILSILLLNSCLTACSSESKIQSSSQTTINDVQSLQSELETKKEIKPSDEILKSDLYDNKIQIGNTVISLPMTFENVTKLGATMNSNTSPDFIMDKDATKTEEFKIGETDFYLYFKNHSSKRSTLKDSEMEFIESTSGKDVYYAKGINIGTSLSQLTEKWGKPTIDLTKQYEDSLTYDYIQYPIDSSLISNFASDSKLSASGNQYTIKIDKNTSKITDIKYNCNAADKSKFYEGVREFGSGESKSQISYKIPAYIYQNNLTNGGLCMNAITVDGETYAVVLDPNLSCFLKTKQINNKTISSEINLDYSNEKYSIDILNMDNNTARAIGYFNSKNMIKCVALYIKEKHEYRSYGSKLISLNGGSISPKAIEEFKKIMNGFVLSIEEKNTNG